MPLVVLGCGDLDAGPVVGLQDAALVQDAAIDAAIDARPIDRGAIDAALDATRDATLDAGQRRDGALLDRGVLDAAAEPEPEPEPDAGVDPDMSWGACAVNGAPGDCLHVDDCAAPRASVPGHCPGPASIQCCVDAPDRPPIQDCNPNDHPQPNADLVEAPGAGGCPAGRLAVAEFCIDRYEASLIHPDGAPWSPYHHPGERALVAVSVAGAVPQGYIDGISAQRACEAAGKRLCTDAEWLRACQGAAARVYPYGDARQPGVCNDARAQHPAAELFPDDPTPFDRIQHPCINQLADGLAPTGAHAECVTAEGAFDMMGNLHEWTADPTGTFRGGFYVDTVRNGPGCLYRTGAHNRQHWDYSTGFRCCADR